MPGGRSDSVSLETEEDEDRSDPYRNWSTHSAEIAKYAHAILPTLRVSGHNFENGKKKKTRLEERPRV